MLNSQEKQNFNKKIYKEHEEIKKLTREEVKKIREEKEIKIIKGEEKEEIKPILEFHQAPFPKGIMDKLSGRGWKEPTPIQSQGWPIALSGKDFVGIAETGSGKTLAFLLPAFVHIRENPENIPGNGPYCLILAPTRELACQIQEVSEEFGRAVRVFSSVVYGGAPRGQQIRQLRRRPDVLIATPGRLIDFVNSGHVNLNYVSYLVLDEADRMLDMGFEPQIRQILDKIPPNRQTLLWSATWPKEVQSLADQFTSNPLRVNIGSLDLSANKNVEQVIHVVEKNEKKEKFVSLLNEIYKKGKILVFVETKSYVDELCAFLKSQRFRVLGIHGDKKQSQREYVLRNFRDGHDSILIATDVASRGL
eukprot:Anaeramoba_ignava/c14187_g1_i1.p1 GENE.c14187_g1_i1~~c14187_g1_i1.p1  ORF type:complete len:363 (-),score=111.64 c14187_g1_i1:299-1387(-)